MSWEAVIALLALLLSVLNACAYYRRGKSKLGIEVKHGILMHDTEGHMVITVRNKRPFQTQIRSIYTPLPGGNTMLYPDLAGEKPLPCDLAPFQSANFWVPLHDVANVLKKHGYKGKTTVVFAVEDGSGSTFRGEGSVLVDEWAK